MTDLFEMNPKQQLTAYAVSRAATSSVVEEVGPEVRALLAQVPRVAVTNEDQYRKAGDLLKLLSVGRRRMEVARKDLVSPVGNAISAVNAFFRETFTGQIDKAVKDVKAKMASWILAETERKRHEAAAAAAEAEARTLAAAERLERDGQGDAAEKVLDQGVKISGHVTDEAKKTAPVYGSYGTTSTRRRWTWDVGNEADIPREYLTVNAKAVSSAVRSGVRDIPGINIYEESTVVIR